MIRKIISLFLLFCTMVLVLAVSAVAADVGYAVLTEFKYDSILQTDGDIVVAVKNSKAGVETFSGKEIAPFQFDNIITKFDENGTLSCFVVAKGDAYGLYSANGKQLLTCIYDEIYFWDGLVFLRIGIENERQSGIYNVNNQKWIVPVEPVSAGRSFVGCVGLGENTVVYEQKLANDETYRLRYFDTDGTLLIESFSTDAKSVVNCWNKDLFTFCDSATEKYGVCDANRNTIIPAEYDDIDYEDGIFYLQTDSHYSTANERGERLLPAEYDYVDATRQIVAKRSGESYNYYTLSGEFIITADQLLDCMSDLIFFKHNGHVGAVTRDGTLTIPFEYGGMESQYPDVAREFAILYKWVLQPDDTEKYIYSAVDKQGTVFITEGNYAFLQCSYPHKTIAALDEQHKFLSIYTSGKRLPITNRNTTSVRTLAEKNCLLLYNYDLKQTRIEAFNGKVLVDWNTFDDVSPIGQIDDTNYFSGRLAAMRNGKYALIEITEQADVPSTWAAPEVEQALALDLVPYELQIGWNRACTREDFCIFTMNAVSNITGLSLDELAAKYGAASAFEDCNRYEVNIAYSMGIVSGTGKGKYAPNGQITREQAAAMLARTAALLNIKPNADAPTFADSALFSEYAASAIETVTSIVGNGNAVMVGSGNNNFNPRGTYTREQAILTLLRLWSAA